MKNVIIILGLIFGNNISQAKSNKILVVLSGENKITLKDGVVHPTGYFLSELMVPVKGLIEDGYEPIFATPDGNEPVMDKVSDSAFWFGGNEHEYIAIKKLKKSLIGLSRPLRLSKALTMRSKFVGLLVPGGHAPMEDLLKDKYLGELLRYFHYTKKPTALICHGPIALLSALNDANSFAASLAENKVPAPQKWIYSGYRMTSFSTPEEQQEEPGQDNALGGYVKFYPDQALSTAGGIISIAPKWQSHVVRDRELITAQNPFSDKEFTRVFLQALDEKLFENF